MTNTSGRGGSSINRLFLAGASGAIGRSVVPLLVAKGWQVFGTTRSASKVSVLRDLGVHPIVVDVFDLATLRRVLVECAPEIVMHQLTDLPYALEGSKMEEALVRNARLRDEGTRNLVEAAKDAGVKRMIAQSIAFIYADGQRPNREEDPLMPETDPVYGGTVTGVMSLERQVLSAPFDGIVLRYGLLYGPGTGFDKPIGPGSVHVEAAAKAAELAIHSGSSGIYNIAESGGAALSTKAMAALNWSPDWRMSAQQS